MKKRELRERLSAVQERCAELGHPVGPWVDRSAEMGFTFTERKGCPCGHTGEWGGNVPIALRISWASGQTSITQGTPRCSACGAWHWPGVCSAGGASA